ncbi:MAG: DedA family protein [Gammaproteobacteria bacterium]|nr:MAG: DedA family protein [Gammaproteobacteria bacterium]
MDITKVLLEHRHITMPLVILIMALESAPVVGFFLPGVLILPALGAMTATTGESFWLIYSGCVLGSLLGDALGYGLGRLGRTEPPRWLKSRRYHKAIERAVGLVNRRGALALFFGRFAWLVHPAVPPAAGYLGISAGRFFLVDILTVALWVFIYMGLGRIAMGAWVRYSAYAIGIGGLIAFVLVLVVIARKARRYLRRRRQRG